MRIIYLDPQKVDEVLDCKNLPHSELLVGRHTILTETHNFIPFVEMTPEIFQFIRDKDKYQRENEERKEKLENIKKCIIENEIVTHDDFDCDY